MAPQGALHGLTVSFLHAQNQSRTDPDGNKAWSLVQSATTLESKKQHSAQHGSRVLSHTLSLTLAGKPAECLLPWTKRKIRSCISTCFLPQTKVLKGNDILNLHTQAGLIRTALEAVVALHIADDLFGHCRLK